MGSVHVHVLHQLGVLAAHDQAACVTIVDLQGNETKVITVSIYHAGIQGLGAVAAAAGSGIVWT